MATTPRKLFGTRAASALLTGEESLPILQSAAIVQGPMRLPIARAATTAALAANTRTGNILNADANGALAAIDGVTLALGDRLLVKNEATGANRGIYRVTALGGVSAKWQLTRSADGDASADVQGGQTWYIQEGTVNGGSQWALTTTGVITLNTTALVFSRIARADNATLRYDPDRQPASGLSASHSDNFLGGAQLSWRWGNQGTATITHVRDTAELVATATAGVQRRIRWIDSPSAVDFTIVAKLHMRLGAANASAGLYVLTGGTEGSPTRMDSIRCYFGTAAESDFIVQTAYFSGYTDAGTQIAEVAWASRGGLAGMPVYLSLVYTASSKTMDWRYTHFGYPPLILKPTTYNSANHPISIGFGVDSQNASFSSALVLPWFRVFTSAAGASSDQLTGNVFGA